MRFLLLSLVLFLGYGCGESTPKTAEEIAFDAANKQIVSDEGGAYYGNSEAAKAMVKRFSENIGSMQKLMFSGGKENRKISLTGEKFLTYCQLNENSALFLVHVPQFKRYKGEVRDTLLDLAWTVSGLVLEEYKKDQKIDVAIGLKGSVIYGGSAIGERGKTPKYENSFSIDSDQFHKYFKKSAAANPKAEEKSPDKEPAK